ncbi:MAG: Ditrans,polycis-undecaprenyl-diphosphate synthase ((2E,6E)-farnesyl-diphosphate specific) [Candidatus Omnitrophica bacterium ADurb.Bin205]|nr:MAG: Ditrans,polycis-undecaprenyl-diphosphate synthase ((2E,6E)-farnesyl-diphosphate specific) [Candidatus Omnitrophica bacterium ADurb.Bin205]
MIERNVTPKHVAIIMDGNGRWAKERNLPRSYGHREGVKRVKDVVKAAADLGIKVVTFFAFSTENWVRPQKEISMLMRYLNSFLLQEVNRLHKNNMRFKVIGGDDPLPLSIQHKIKKAEAKTAGNTGLTVVLALNYGSRQEIVEAAKNFAKDVASGSLKAEDLDVEKFSKYLYTSSLEGVDLLIRTSGEMRISNFLLWQISYAELYFTNKLWPDFKAKDFCEAIDDYKRRERRFGGI